MLQLKHSYKFDHLYPASIEDLLQAIPTFHLKYCIQRSLIQLSIPKDIKQNIV